MKITSITRKQTLILIICIALIQTVVLSGIFVLKKNIFRGDEIYSYATSNSSETMSPVIDYDGTLHLNEWIPVDNLMQSVMVSKDEVFNYRHINEILKDDAHPPLYFYLLHFFSSFFINQFSWVPSLIINGISIFVLQIFFYRLFLLLSGERFHSILAMIFLGFTSGSINMISFSRNYTLMTMFTVMFTFYILRTMYQHHTSTSSTKSIIMASICLYFASLTQYLAIVYAFILTALICTYYFIKEDYKIMFKIGLAMSSAVLLMTLSFHYVFDQLSSEQSSMDNASAYPFSFELRIAIHIIINELFGIKTPTSPTMFPFWFFWGIIAILIILTIITLLFRKDPWFIKLRKNLLTRMVNLFKQLNSVKTLQYVILLLTTIATVYIISYKFKIYYFYPTSDRYLFIIYPCVAIIILIPVFKFLKKNIFNSLVIVILVSLSIILGEKPYIGSPDISINEANRIMKDSDVIVFSQDHATGPLLSLLYLSECDRVYYTTDSSFEEQKNDFIADVSDSRPLYMLYAWPSYSVGDTSKQILNTLKDLQTNGIITTNDTPKNHGAKLIGNLGSLVFLQLR